MTGPRLNYRSDCGTVIFVEFRDPVSQAMYLDGPDSMAPYRPNRKPGAGRTPVHLTLDFRRPGPDMAPESRGPA